MRKVRQNLLVASGDQSVFAADQEVFAGDGTTNVKNGQLVVWDPLTNLSLGPTITCSDYDKIVISVGYKGKLRSCFGDVLYGCDIQAINAQAPSCGVPDIWDLYFNDVTCGEAVSVTVTVDDDDTRNLFPWNKREAYVATVDTQTCACSDCASGFDAKKLACKIASQFNNNGYNDLPVTKKAYFKNIPAATGNKFTAHVLYGGANTNKVYCINPVTGACGDCDDANVAIKSFKYDTTEIITFPNTTNEADDATLIEKLASIVAKINEALGDNGSAALTKGSGECCAWRLEINSCFTDAALYSDTGATAAIATCVAANDPIDPVTVDSDCLNCEDATTTTFAAGVRFIAAPYELNCNPNAPVPNPVQGIGLRKLNVIPTKGFDCGKSHVIHFQEASAPENLGYHFQWKDFASANGGSGRGHEPFVRQGYGPLGLPLGIGRDGAVAPLCKESYCSYAIEHSIPYRDQTVYGTQVHPRGTTIVIIPSGDTTTKTEFEAIINNYIPSCECPIKSAVTCA
jgi:hypothetical protein